MRTLPMDRRTVVRPALMRRPGTAAPAFQAQASGRRWPPLPVLLYLLLILLPLHFDLGGLFMTGIRALLLLLMLPMVRMVLTGRAGRLVLADLVLLLYGIWVIYTLSLNSPGQALSFGGSVFLEAFGAYLLARIWVRTPADFLATCRVIFLVVLVTLPFALYESQTGRAPIPRMIENLPFFYSVSDFFNEAAGRRLGLERSQVIFTHPIHYGLFCSTTLALAFTGLRGRVHTPLRYLLTGLMMLGVFLSLSSGAILPMLLQFGLILWAWAMGRVRQRWLILGGLATLAYVIVDLLSNRTPVQVFLHYATFSSHTAYWRLLIFEWGMKNVWASPFTGIGLQDWVRPWFMNSGSMDNFWLLNTVRYGIPGFALLTLGFGTAMWRIARMPLDHDPLRWQLRRAWMFVMVGLILTLCTVDVWATALSYVFFLLGCGIWLLAPATAPPTSTAPPAATTDPEMEPTRTTQRFTRFPPPAPEKG